MGEEDTFIFMTLIVASIAFYLYQTIREMPTRSAWDNVKEVSFWIFTLVVLAISLFLWSYFNK